MNDYSFDRSPEVMAEISRLFHQMDCNQEILCLEVMLSNSGELVHVSPEDDNAPSLSEPVYYPHRPLNLLHALEDLSEKCNPAVRRLLPVSEGGLVKDGAWPVLHVMLRAEESRELLLSLDFDVFSKHDEPSRAQFQPVFGYDTDTETKIDFETFQKNPRALFPYILGPTLEEFRVATLKATDHNDWQALNIPYVEFKSGQEFTL